mmetsp:Transcript_15115/g.38335  ORF Transcript_15115/g.38335 Transcript_15115/m.38335 type:complete len:826 (-) Transcript_15115:1164-3641(-)
MAVPSRESHFKVISSSSRSGGLSARLLPREANPSSLESVPSVLNLTIWENQTRTRRVFSFPSSALLSDVRKQVEEQMCAGNKKLSKHLEKLQFFYATTHTWLTDLSRTLASYLLRDGDELELSKHIKKAMHISVRSLDHETYEMEFYPDTAVMAVLQQYPYKLPGHVYKVFFVKGRGENARFPMENLDMALLACGVANKDTLEIVKITKPDMKVDPLSSPTELTTMGLPQKTNPSDSVVLAAGSSVPSSTSLASSSTPSTLESSPMPTGAPSLPSLPSSTPAPAPLPVAPPVSVPSPDTGASSTPAPVDPNLLPPPLVCAPVQRATSSSSVKPAVAPAQFKKQASILENLLSGRPARNELESRKILKTRSRTKGKFAMLSDFLGSRPKKEELEQKQIIREKESLSMQYCEMFLARLRELNASEMEGIFRISGDTRAKMEIIGSLALGRLDLANYDVHDVSSAFKMYLRELPLPVVPFGLHDRFVALAGEPPDESGEEVSKSAQKKRGSAYVRELAELFLCLPPTHKYALQLLFDFLVEVASNQENNLMSEENLGIVFGPTLLREEHASNDMFGSTMKAQANVVTTYLTLWKKVSILVGKPIQPPTQLETGSLQAGFDLVLPVIECTALEDSPLPPLPPLPRDFRADPFFLTIHSPTHTSSVLCGQVFVIEWEHQGDIRTVDIFLRRGRYKDPNQAEAVSALALEHKNNGRFRWAVPTSLAVDENYFVMIRNKTLKNQPFIYSAYFQVVDQTRLSEDNAKHIAFIKNLTASISSRSPQARTQAAFLLSSILEEKDGHLTEFLRKNPDHLLQLTNILAKTLANATTS